MSDILYALEHSNNKVYQYFLNKSKNFIQELAENHITKTAYRNTVSENSFSFKKLDGGELGTLKEIFGDINEDSFKNATKGQGNELKRILTMHSSALLALLFFQSVSEDNPLSITINGKEYKFTSVDFEYENKCLDGRDSNGVEYRPSCVDVKLTDKEQHVVLFLESKLSEYLHNGKQTGISMEYHKQYREIFEKGELIDGLIIKEEDGTLTLTTTKRRCSHYCQGIKQMMCHFIGAMNYKAKHQDEEVLLGTILLDMSSIDESRYKEYCKDYKQLADKLTRLGKEVKMIGTPLTYQELYNNLKGFKLSDRVVEYYGLNK